MSLVQYDSSDDSSDEDSSLIAAKGPVIETNETLKEFSISKFLPPPKRTNDISQSKSQVLGKAIKNTVNAMIAHNSDGIILPKSEKKVTSFIPSSVRSKAKSNTMEKSTITEAPSLQSPQREKNQHSLNLFNQVKPRTKRLVDNNESIGIRSLNMDIDTEMIPDASLEHDHEDSKQDDIKEFNMDDFYTENIQLKAEGQLQENKRLYSVANNKNQLSSLIKNAQQNEELLNEKFERNKKSRKERESRYGF